MTLAEDKYAKTNPLSQYTEIECIYTRLINVVTHMSRSSPPGLNNKSPHKAKDLRKFEQKTEKLWHLGLPRYGSFIGGNEKKPWDLGVPCDALSINPCGHGRCRCQDSIATASFQEHLPHPSSKSLAGTAPAHHLIQRDKEVPHFALRHLAQHHLHTCESTNNDDCKKCNPTSLGPL
jgi:hypothetical protein